MKQRMPSFALHITRPTHARHAMQRLAGIVAAFFAALLMLSTAHATPLVIDLDLSGYANGTPISSQIAGVSFSMTDQNNVAVGAPTVLDGGLSNELVTSPGRGAYIYVTFAAAASNVSFDYAGSNPRDNGLGTITYQALGINGNVIASGPLFSLDSLTLPDGVKQIVFNTYTGHESEFGGKLEAQEFRFGNLHAELDVAAVPEPETYAMLTAGLALMGCMARRRRAKPR